jgi:hypothetical protein
MKSFSGKMLMAAACAGLVISLTAGSVLAGDRGRDGGRYDRDHRGWSSHYDRCYRGGYYRPYCYGYVGCYSPVCVEAAYCPEPVVCAEPAPVVVAPAPVYVAPAPVVVYPAPVVRERVVVRAGYRGWGVGFYYGR